MKPENTITTTCPECANTYRVPESLLGRNGRCEVCQARFTISASARSLAAATTRQRNIPPGVSSSSGALMFIALVMLLTAGAGYWLFAQRPPDGGGGVVTSGSDPDVGVDASTGLESLEKSFPIVEKFVPIDIRQYRATYADVAQGWMPNGADQAEEASRWGSHLGPLGVRVRSHVPQLQHWAAFAAIVPSSLRSMTGELALTAAEVVSIAPGSPAAGHLEIGDLIIGIEGEMLQSGNQYRPGWNFMHKDARELQLMLGEKIDQAQGRGDIRFTLLRIPQDSARPLPVERKVIWQGKAGSQPIGTQDFELEIPGDGFITLETHQFDDSIHGDGAVWLDVTLEGDYGVKSLLEMASEAVQAGYGRPSLETEKSIEINGKSYRQALKLHATGFGKWRIPEGTRKIEGHFAALSYGKVQPRVYHTNSALPLTGFHKDHVVEVRFPIGQIGSFSATFPKDCAKTERTVRRHTAWLAAQQREDGSWPRLAGYTTDGWDTAWCGLALMSSGDAGYDAQVRKAAYRIAYDQAPSEWTAERSMRLIFLCEYFLRTQDPGIVAGIQAAYLQLADVCKNDFMAGHKVNGFGYGIAGQHYGTGHLALGMALASRTPITFDRDLVGNIIRHAGVVCVNGTYAYGRGRRMARSNERQFAGGNAMSGPGLLGVQIGGGHASAVREFAERMDASIGDGDNSHATSSLAFIFGSLALANADEAVFLKHMQNFRYKLTLDDCWEGGILKSAFPLDLQGGEGVTANWIRTAGTILVFNALKKNMAITGKRDLWNPKQLDYQPVCEWGGQVHSYYLRNWALASELLGPKSPPQLRDGIKELHALRRDIGLVPATRSIVERLAPGLISTLAVDASLPDVSKAHAIELISGLDFQIHDKKEGDRLRLELQVTLPMHQLNWPDADKTAMHTSSSLPMRSKVEILSENFTAPLVFETEGLAQFDLDQGTRKFVVTQILKDTRLDSFDGVARISFRIGGHELSYLRPLKFNTEFSHSNNINLRRLSLQLKLAPRAYFQSQPLVIAGIPFDCMYPSERMLEIQGPAAGVAVKPHEGDTVIVDLASENFICPWVHAIRFEQPSQVVLPALTRVTAVVGKIEGDMLHLSDFSLETRCKFTSDGPVTIAEFDYGNPVSLNGLDADFPGTRFLRIWYHDGSDWIPLVWDNYSVGTGHHPVFPLTTARLWRLELGHTGPLEVATLRFYNNPNTLMKRESLPQSIDKRYQPALPTMMP